MAMLSTWLTDTVGAVTGISTAKLVIVFATITFVYTLLSGLIGIAYTDIPQFLVYLIANIIFIPFCIKAAGGLSVMYDTVEATRGVAFLQPVPPTDPVPPTRSFATLTFLVFLFQGMWSTVSGSTAQRFAAAKNEFHAIMGQALSTVLSLVVRIAPLIVIGIAAAAIYPADFAESGKLYGLMILKCAPIGLVGLLIVSELAGYMSSMDTTMNFGASLIVNDVYRRFLNKNASDRHYVVMGQIATGLMTVAAILVAINIVKGDQSWFLFTNGVLGSFALCVGVLRFTWWRFNKYAELGAMILAFPLGYIVWFKLEYYDKPFWQALLLLAGTGFVFMVTLALLTPPEDPEKLRKFYKRCLPFGFWGPIKKGVELDDYSLKLLNYKSDFVDIGLSVAFSASLVIAANALFGLWFRTSAGCLIISILTGWILLKRWQRRGFLSSLNEEEVILARDDFEGARGKT
jgi:Na+/proline symporter